MSTKQRLPNGPARQVVQAAEKRGWEVERFGKRTILLRWPHAPAGEGRGFVARGSDRKAYMNNEAQLRRIEAQWPAPGETVQLPGLEAPEPVIADPIPPAPEPQPEPEAPTELETPVTDPAPNLPETVDLPSDSGLLPYPFHPATFQDAAARIMAIASDGGPLTVKDIYDYFLALDPAWGPAWGSTEKIARRSIRRTINNTTFNLAARDPQLPPMFDIEEGQPGIRGGDPGDPLVRLIGLYEIPTEPPTIPAARAEPVDDDGLLKYPVTKKGFTDCVARIVAAGPQHASNIPRVAALIDPAWADLWELSSTRTPLESAQAYNNNHEPPLFEIDGDVISYSPRYAPPTGSLGLPNRAKMFEDPKVQKAIRAAKASVSTPAPTPRPAPAPAPVVAPAPPAPEPERNGRPAYALDVARQPVGPPVALPVPAPAPVPALPAPAPSTPSADPRIIEILGRTFDGAFMARDENDRLWTVTLTPLS